LWDFTTGRGRLKCKLHGQDGQILELAFSHDAVMFVSSGPGTNMKAWLLDEEPFLKQTMSEDLDLNLHSISLVTVSPDGEYVASVATMYGGTTSMIIIWSISSGKPYQLLPVHEDKIQCLAWFPKSKNEYLVSGGQDKAIRIWDTTNGEQLAIAEGVHDICVSCAAVNFNANLLVSGSHDHCVKVWNVCEDKDLVLRHVLKGHHNAVNSIAFSPNMNLAVSASSDKTLRVWDTFWGLQLRVLEGHGQEMHTVVWSLDGQHVACTSSDQKVYVWWIDAEVKTYFFSNMSIYSCLLSKAVTLTNHHSLVADAPKH
jgi:WD40 repeat protein